jgi:hypothetical protein
MTKNSPRIYIYKITFEEVRYYYYGVHKEKKFDEYYMGTPVTHKWAWDFYTPKKQILQFFEFSDKGYLEAQEVEKRLIRPFYNTDKWCLNENCAGNFSLKSCREAGKRSGIIQGNKNKENKTGICGMSLEERRKLGSEIGQKTYELKIGIHAQTPEERIENSSLGGKKSYELGVGVHGRTKEQIKLDSSKAGKRAYELGVGVHARTKEDMQEQGRINGTNTYLLGVGIHAQTPEERVEICKLGGKTAYELGVGVHARTKEQMVEHGKKLYELGLGIATVSKEQLRENIKKVNSQKWMCLETGYISNPGGLNSYQKARGIDRSKRIRLSADNNF